MATSERPAITPYLTSRDAAGQLAFLRDVFGATEVNHFVDDDGVVRHATVDIGGSWIMVHDSMDGPRPSPAQLEGSPVAMQVCVDDVDGTIERAIRAGASPLSDVNDHFNGHRAGTISDPWGHVWIVSTLVSEPTDEEIHEGFQAALAAE